MSLALFDLDDFVETRVEWVIVGDWGRCGLCGSKCGYNQGGSRTGAVCDDCAGVDSCRIRPHETVAERRKSGSATNSDEVAHCTQCTWSLFSMRWVESEWVEFSEEEVAAAMAEHVRPRHTSHWGVSHEIADHDRLVAAQEKRRAKYLARGAVAA